MARPSRELFQDLIRKLIKKHGTAKAFAKALGVTEQKISRWKDGVVEPSLSDLDAIAKLEGVPVASLWLDKSDKRIAFIDPDPETALRVIADTVKKISGSGDPEK